VNPSPRLAALIALLAALILLSACIPSAAAAPELPSATSPAPTITRTPTQTGTIVWFPATRTPTPPQVIEALPTVERRPGIGALILEDDFTKANQWSSGPSAAGNVIAGDGALTLAIPNLTGSLISLRGGTTITDFYLEITASLSLCRGEDSYGLLVRAASAQDYYRLLINCQGQVRLERLNNGYITILQDWTFSGQVPPGSPLVLRIGFFAVRGDLRVFINDMYQFSVADTVFSSGTVGVFARSNGQNALTVNFSDLQVHLVDPANVPTNTPTPTITPSPTRTRAPTWTVVPK
jgi:hypothetical protein